MAQDNVFVAGPPRVDIDAGNRAVQPRSNRAVCVMVERVHAGILEAVFISPAVPSLPDGGCALTDRVEPGWPRLLVEKLVGNI